jgi:hypothetical protein
MYKILVALAVAALVAGPGSASEKTDVMAPLHQFVDGFNKEEVRNVARAVVNAVREVRAGRLSAPDAKLDSPRPK